MLLDILITSREVHVWGLTRGLKTLHTSVFIHTILVILIKMTTLIRLFSRDVETSIYTGNERVLVVAWVLLVTIDILLFYWWYSGVVTTATSDTCMYIWLASKNTHHAQSSHIPDSYPAQLTPNTRIHQASVIPVVLVLSVPTSQHLSTSTTNYPTK